ncbi:MAG TPA: Sec-dependent nitrous-oxide reductase, partial [Thermomicrobiales bacterium]|nr:Sec-dependent nitrous-oxide reductase [Thermomicrobiales bacterium]
AQAQSAEDIANARGLTPQDMTAALKTYVPSGKWDEYYIFASGGHGGQVLVVGVPSMRLLKVIGVFTPEPWQGFGFDDGSRAMLEAGGMNGKTLTWADTHHPGLSETNGEYDGQFLFINDKAHARMAVIDLRDFETKQIVKNPHIISNHGGAFVTPNTDYIIDGSQYAAPFGWEYAPLSDYKTSYRGAMTYWKFNRETGRIDPSQSFSIEIPPYWQDLADAGKGPSDGWSFSNSLNTEMALGGIMDGQPPVEAGASMRDMDYLSVINWRKAAEVIANGGGEDVKGMKMIRMADAVSNGLIYQVPEPKSPHGVDVTPDGKYLVVAGKLDPHVTIYSFQKIQDAIAAGGYSTDEFGVPVLDFATCVEAQVELGLGPLHTQFDNAGNAYTSLFLDSAIAKWKLGGEGVEGGWTLIEKIPVNYNVGHLTAIEGDTVTPQGNFVIALNKWAIDRFAPVGPLHPQNFQLIDITGETMQVLYDMPIGIGEPHYAQTIRASKLQPWVTYPEMGFDSLEMKKKEGAPEPGKEGVIVEGNKVTINMTSVRSHFTPDNIEVPVGSEVTWNITNIEMAEDATHGFALPGQNINLSIEPGESTTITFTADTAGVYPYYCTEFCSALHLEMMGYFLVKP